MVVVQSNAAHYGRFQTRGILREMSSEGLVHVSMEEAAELTRRINALIFAPPPTAP